MWRRVLGAVLGAAVFLLGAGAAAADEEIRYAPPPAWVKVAPVETPPPATDADGALRVVHLDTQARYGPDGDEYYSDRAIQALSRQALEALGTVGQAWHPGTQSLTIHKVEIIRDGKVIDAMATGDPFVALRQETNLARAVLDGQLTATKQLEDLRVGDIVRIATTMRYSDPMVRGHSQYATGLSSEGPAIGFLRQRHLWDADKPMKWRAGEGLPRPVVTRTADGFELVLEGRNLKGPILPAGAPARYGQLGLLTLSDFASWKEVSALFAPDYAAASALKPDSPLKTEVEAIRQAHATPVARASAALALVQDRVRYLALAMGEGGFKPAEADQTWSRKFGDCKGKSALLVALLKELGIEAEVAAVSLSGDDGYDEILPRLAFDHVIVRATIDGKTYWLDPTRQGDVDIARLTPPAYRWALPIRAGGAGLEEIRQVVPTTPQNEIVIDLDFTGGLDLDAPLKARVTYRGDQAVEQYAMLSIPTRSEAEAMLKEQWSTNKWLIDKTSFGREDDGTVWVEVTGKLRQVWPRQGDRRQFQAPYSSTEPKFAERETGSLEPRAPYAVAHPFYNRYVTRARLPGGGAGFEIVGKDLDIKAAGQWIVRRARIEGGVAIVEEDDRSIGPEIAFAEAAAGVARLKAAGAAEEVIVRAPANFRLSAAEIDKVATERQSRDAFLMRAQSSLAARDYDRTLEDLDRVLAENPTDLTALTRRASTRMTLKDWEGALKDLDAGIALAPENGALRNYRSGVYLELGKPDLALADADASVAAAPNDWTPLVLRAQVRERLGDLEGKLADYAKAVALAPDNLPLQQNYLYLLHGRGANADGELKGALEKLHADRIAAAPKDPVRYMARAQMRGANGDPEGAMEDFGRAIELAPSAQAYLSRADAWREQGQKAKALADLDAAVRLDQSPRALLARARYNAMEGTPAQWLADARAARQKAPSDLAALEEVARAALVAGDKDRAREAANEITRIKPNDLESLRLRALVKEQSGDLAGAIADMKAGLAGPVGMTTAGRSGRLRLAALLDQAGHGAEAVAVLAEARKAFPEDAEIAGRLCRLKAARNVEAGSAIADCDAALALSPDDPDYLDSLGLANLRLGRFDHAVAAYDEALAIRPGQTTSLYGRALAREGAADLAGAREDAARAARYNRGGIKEMTGTGLAARDPGVIQAFAGQTVAEVETTLPKGSVIKRPDWAAMPPTPEFPDRAREAGRSGKVWVRCTVMSGGQLVNCSLENERPHDYEFGEAILKGTKDMRMNPMTVDGQPVDGAEIRFASPFLY